MFKFNPVSGKYTVLHSFAGLPSDGATPYASLLFGSDGTLYGTTRLGGTANLGTVFELKGSTLTVLHSFTGLNFKLLDGQYPTASLIRDSAGNLYGTTPEGGSTLNYGIVFELSAAGSYTILHNFNDVRPGGRYPYGGLRRDPTGNLYGTTYGGGKDNEGTIFEWTP